MRNTLIVVIATLIAVAGITPASAQESSPRRADLRDREVREYIMEEFVVPGVINDIQFVNNEQIDTFIQGEMVIEDETISIPFPVGYSNDPGLMRLRVEENSRSFVEKRDGLRVRLFTVFTQDLLAPDYRPSEVDVRIVKLVTVLRRADGTKRQMTRYEVRLDQPLLHGGQILVLYNVRTGYVQKQGFVVGFR